MEGHKVDDFGSHQFRRDGKIAFVFAIFIVDDYQHFAGAKVLNSFWNGGKGHRELTTSIGSAAAGSRIIVM